MTYKPNPIDTSGIQLEDNLNNLIEKLAENAHDVWAATRIKDGWEYGLERNDNQKKHPCLIPYNQLPESEKEYDRNMAIETIKSIIVLGYKVTK